MRGGFTLHSRRIRVLHFEPIGRAAGTVGGLLALRDDALKTHFAGVRADRRAVALDMLVEPDDRASLGYDRRKRGFADLKRIAPQIIAVQLDEVIPNPIDQNPWAHWRSPMDMMRQGWSTSL